MSERKRDYWIWAPVVVGLVMYGAIVWAAFHPRTHAADCAKTEAKQ